MAESIEQYERKQDRLEEGADALALEIERELEAEDALWNRLTKEGRIQAPDY